MNPMPATDEDYVSGDEDEPVAGAAVAGANQTDEEYDAEMALLDGKGGAQKPDLKISTMDSSNGATARDEAKEEPKKRASKRASKMLGRHKSSAFVGKQKLSYSLQPKLLDDGLHKQVDEMTLKESFEVLKTVLSKNDQLFEHLRKFHIQNV